MSKLTTAVVGDLCTHKAKIITGSPTRDANGKPVARLGDMVLCPRHGKSPIVEVNAGMPITDGNLTAHQNAKAACGARILYSIHDNPSPASGLSPANFALMENDDFLDQEGAVDTSTAAGAARDRAIKAAAAGSEGDSDPSDATDAPNTQATPAKCLDIPENAGPTFRLSQFFLLRDLSSGAACARQPGARSGAVVANKGLNRATIICNLRHLAVNSLDPIARHYGRKNMIITSGFRRASNGSDHNIGSAVDIQFLVNGRKANGRELDRIQKHIINELKIPFTQIIHENNSWLHIACRRNGVNSAKRICWWAGGQYNSGYRY